MATKPKDARDTLDAGTSTESNELSAITVKSLSNLEEKVDAIDWKLWEIYNIIKNYVEIVTPDGPTAPAVHQQPSASDIAAEIAKALSVPEGKESKSVVGKLFGN